MTNSTKLNRIILPLYFVLTGMWWGWTVLIDIFVIPTVFKTIDQFFVAGELGIAVFSKLNNLELITSSILLATLLTHFGRKKKFSILLILSFLTWTLAMIYFSYLTPKIVELTELWRKADLIGLSGVSGVEDIQQSHQYFHNLYIKFDSLKLLLLTAMLVVGYWKQEELR
jgi:hypothetical protein